MLFRQIQHRQLQDVQFYGTLCGVPSHHVAVSSLEMLTAKRVPSPLSTYFILITCPLLHTSVSLYTEGLWSSFSKEAGILYGSVYLMLWTGGSFLLALLLTMCRFVFHAFFPIYK